MTLSVVTIAVRVDVASATGSYGSAHSHDWSSERGHHDLTRHKWFEGEDSYHHAGDLLDEDNSCSCQTDDADQSTNASQDETTDESMPNADDADEIDSEDTSVDSHEDSCHDSDSANDTDNDTDSEVSDEQPADESPENPPSYQSEARSLHQLMMVMLTETQILHVAMMIVNSPQLSQRILQTKQLN